jgi:hypothetical protein
MLQRFRRKVTGEFPWPPIVPNLFSQQPFIQLDAKERLVHNEIASWLVRKGADGVRLRGVQRCNGNRADAMTIYGLSQSSGVERRLNVERGGQGIVLTFTDHVGGKERERILVQPDNLLATIMDPPPGGSTVEGISPPHGAKMLLDVEVRRNEVLLRAHADLGEGADVAVGLDDFQDALEGVITPG